VHSGRALRHRRRGDRLRFPFRHKRAGSPAYLAEQGARLGFAVDIVPPLEDEGRRCPPAVRMALSQGKWWRRPNSWRALVRFRRGYPRAKRGTNSAFHRQSQARSLVRPQARHLRGARRHRRQAPRRGGQFRRAPDVRRARRCWRCFCSTSTAISTETSTSPSSAGSATSRNSIPSRRSSARCGRQRPGARRAQARRQGVSGAGGDLISYPSPLAGRVVGEAGPGGMRNPTRLASLHSRCSASAFL